MAKMPKVSIIIPVYNGAKYVEQALNSALNQTYPNIEIIVVNDGSKDNTDDILQKYKKKVKYFKKENGGVSTALNLAIQKSTGKYFSWLSHDDLYYPTKIEEEMKIITDKTIIMSDYDVIDENGNITKYEYLPHELIERHPEYALFKGYINGVSLLIPKQAFADAGLFAIDKHCTQDYYMWLAMILKGYKFVHIPKILVSSRQHREQVTNTSPLMLSEGNQLWIDMMTKLPLKTKKKMSNTEYSFYKDMETLLKITPYQNAINFAKNMQKKLKSEINSDSIVVSVIMVTTNESPASINKAISSVLEQTHKNLELIIVNDNPSNYSKKDLNAFSKDKRIKYIENKIPIGLVYSRNKAIENTKGTYIEFITANTEYLKDKTTCQLTELLRCSKKFSHTSYIDMKSKKTIDTSNQNGDLLRECINNCLITLPTIMIEKNLLLNHQFTFEEDKIFILSILEEEPIVAVEKALVKINMPPSDTDTQVKNLKQLLTYVLNNKTLSACNTQIDELITTIVKLNNPKYDRFYYNEYQKVINSKSWKITKPIRQITNTIARQKKKLSSIKVLIK